MSQVSTGENWETKLHYYIVMAVSVVMIDIAYRTIMLWLFFILFVNNANAQGMLVEFQMLNGQFLPLK